MKHIFFIFLLLIHSFSNATQDLENNFWECDYISSTQEVSLDEGAICYIIYQTLLEKKFKGSFKDFMVWWKEHKEKEYKKRRN